MGGIACGGCEYVWVHACGSTGDAQQVVETWPLPHNSTAEVVLMKCMACGVVNAHVHSSRVHNSGGMMMAHSSITQEGARFLLRVLQEPHVNHSDLERKIGQYMSVVTYLVGFPFHSG